MRADPKANTRGLPTLPALASPLNGIVEIAGPDQFRLDELIHRAFADWLSCSTAQQQPAPSVRGA